MSARNIRTSIRRRDPRTTSERPQRALEGLGGSLEGQGKKASEGFGGQDGRTDRRTDGYTRITICALQDIVSCGAAALHRIAEKYNGGAGLTITCLLQLESVAEISNF